MDRIRILIIYYYLLQIWLLKEKKSWKMITFA